MYWLRATRPTAAPAPRVVIVGGLCGRVPAERDERDGPEDTAAQHAKEHRCRRGPRYGLRAADERQTDAQDRAHQETEAHGRSVRKHELGDLEPWTPGRRPLLRRGRPGPRARRRAPRRPSPRGDEPLDSRGGRGTESNPTPGRRHLTARGAQDRPPAVLRHARRDGDRRRERLSHALHVGRSKIDRVDAVPDRGRVPRGGGPPVPVTAKKPMPAQRRTWATAAAPTPHRRPRATATVARLRVRRDVGTGRRAAARGEHVRPTCGCSCSSRTRGRPRRSGRRRGSDRTPARWSARRCPGWCRSRG